MSTESFSIKKGRKLTTIVVADVCGFTKSAERDEPATITGVQATFDLFGSVADSYGGRVFSKAGDGFCAEFPSAKSGLDAANSFIQGIEARVTPQHGLKVRVGLHVGDVYEQYDGDLLGHGVNIAARLQELAKPNQVLVSANVMSLVGHLFRGQKFSRGDIYLKNISEPIHAYDLVSKPSSLLRFEFERFWNHAKAPLVTAAICLVLMISWINVFNPDPPSEAVVSRRIEALENAIASENSTKLNTLSSQGINATYIRSVLRGLAQVNRPSSDAVMALIVEGDIESAIIKLEEELSPHGPEDPSYLQILHQIGALAYFSDPQKAVATYEILELVDGDDPYARVRLAQAYDVINAVDEARALYDEALAASDISKHDYLALQMDLAFNLILKGQADEAIALFQIIEKDVYELNDVRLQARFLTEMGIAWERVGQLSDAESSLVAALAFHNKNGFLKDASRSYNVLGLIADRRAVIEPENKTKLLQHAKNMFERQYELDVALERKHGVAEALYYLSTISFKLGDLDTAKAQALHALRLASEHGIPNIEFMTWISLAQITAASGQIDTACEHVQRAELLLHSEIQSHVGPRTTEMILGLGCPFSNYQKSK